ncbi:hypothetical protein ABK040_011163 [Willaertia magna]
MQQDSNNTNSTEGKANDMKKNETKKTTRSPRPKRQTPSSAPKKHNKNKPFLMKGFLTFKMNGLPVRASAPLTLKLKKEPQVSNNFRVCAIRKDNKTILAIRKKDIIKP